MGEHVWGLGREGGMILQQSRPQKAQQGPVCERVVSYVCMCVCMCMCVRVCSRVCTCVLVDAYTRGKVLQLVPHSSLVSLICNCLYACM
jgi:hypothetical protein